MFLIYDYRDRFSSVSADTESLQSVAEFSYNQLKIWLIIHTIAIRKINSLSMHSVKLHSLLRGAVLLHIACSELVKLDY